ncbi:MAG: penicillin-binding protein 1C [Elusimicrobia bacterium]|nr:penicillin-binding protein 1C [Elusimicrobiota bacterium]
MKRRAAAALVLLALAAAALRAALPRPAPLREGFPFSRAVYARDGRLLQLTLAADGRYRLWVPLREMSPLLVEATLLHEDRRFRLHPGVDPASLLRSAWTTYAARARRRGGSTITMQLARLKYGIDSSRPSGKILQILRALQIELLYSKDRILEAYLNLVPYGGNIEGAGAASFAYFGKDVSRLDLSEAITLAVIPQTPVRRAMTKAERADRRTLEEARRRLFARWIVLHPQDARLGAALEAPWEVRGPRRLPLAAPHFARRALARSREERIVTTLDPEAQALLERLISGFVERRRERGVRNAAALLVAFTTMETVAAVGSADYRDESILGQVSALTARRSPGSTLKPFVYALAFEQGLVHPRSLLKDAPAAFGAYDPENFDGDFEGPLTAGEALVKSRNIPAVSLASRLAPPGLHGFLRAAGVDLPRPAEHYGLGLALGAGEATMEDLARLYAMLGNGGELKPLRRAAADPREPGARLLSRDAVFLAMEALKANPRPRQSFREDWRAAALPVYWKTGTSWAFRDAWAAGVFGPYALVVWIGDFRGDGNPAFVGAEAAAPLFFDIADALRSRGPLRDAYALGQRGLTAVPLEVCAASGAAPGPHCPRREKTWFIPGVSPIAACDVHREVLVDARSGLRACRREGARAEVFEFWPSDLLRIFRRAGVPRRTPPAYDPACGLTDRSGRGLPPRIASPLSGVTYHASAAAPGPIPLSAVADADAGELYWFADGALLGSAPAGKPLFWTPRPGRSVVRVVDDQGRGDAREVEVAFSE